MCPSLSDRVRTHARATNIALEFEGHLRQQVPQTATAVELLHNRRIILSTYNRIKVSTHHYDLIGVLTD